MRGSIIFAVCRRIHRQKSYPCGHIREQRRQELHAISNQDRGQEVVRIEKRTMTGADEVTLLDFVCPTLYLRLLKRCVLHICSLAELIESLKLGNVWTFGHPLLINQLNKNPKIA